MDSRFRGNDTETVLGWQSKNFCMTEHKRPGRDEYYMMIAMTVRSRANCKGNKVGALIVVGDRVVSTGYNGTPSGMTNCLDGGCDRCSNRGNYESGKGYDLCICVHAEQNALLSAARHGIAVQGGTMYSTMRPCFGCTKELLQAGIAQVYYVHDWRYPDDDVQEAYERIQNRIPRGVKKLDMADPEADWAVSTRREAASNRTGAIIDPDDGHPAERVEVKK
jgi:dCMP deaminase